MWIIIIIFSFMVLATITLFLSILFAHKEINEMERWYDR
jgi:hypothetical protein